MQNKLDINCDLGEGMGSDEAMMPFLDSCNIACGGHAGDDRSIAATVDQAVRHGVKVGAHPSYPDRKNFGRKPLEIPFTKLQDSLMDQILRVKESAKNHQIPLHHIKLHGALYLESLTNASLADNLIDFLQKEFPEQWIYAPFGSAIAQAGMAKNARITYEVFADRMYLSASQLLSRTHPRAIITDLTKIIEQVSLFVKERRVKTINGDYHSLKADTICIHGDHPLAVKIAPLVARLTAGTQFP